MEKLSYEKHWLAQRVDYETKSILFQVVQSVTLKCGEISVHNQNYQ